MRAAVLHSAGSPLAIEDIHVSNPGPGEVLVQVAATGLCHTDLHFMQGKLPLSVPAVLGHETAGVVLAVGDGVNYLAPGDHVIGCLSAFCGCCELCLAGQPSICEGQTALLRAAGAPPRLTLNGSPLTQFMHLSGFAEQMLAHEHALAKIDKAMPLDRAALIGCAVTTGFGAVTRTARIRAGSSVAVIGCGAVGLSTIQSARLAGALDVIAIDVNAGRLEMAKRLGATYVINSATTDPITAVHEATDGKGVHTSFEAVGSPALVQQAFLMTRKGGTTVMIGLMPAGARVDLPFSPFIAERRLMGCDMGSNQFRTDMARLVRLYLDGRLALDDLLTDRITLENINDGFAAMERGEGVRTIVSIGL